MFCFTKKYVKNVCGNGLVVEENMLAYNSGILGAITDIPL